MNGLRKTVCDKRIKYAILSKDVAKVVLTAEKAGDVDTAALAAISRLLLFRVPSKAIPLEWDGEHSRVELHTDCAKVTLVRRKNPNSPSVVERYCCCNSSGTPATCSRVGKVIADCPFFRSLQLQSPESRLPSRYAVLR